MRCWQKNWVLDIRNGAAGEGRECACGEAALESQAEELGAGHQEGQGSSFRRMGRGQHASSGVVGRACMHCCSVCRRRWWQVSCALHSSHTPGNAPSPMRPCSLPTTILLNRLSSVLKKYLQQSSRAGQQGGAACGGSNDFGFQNAAALKFCTLHHSALHLVTHQVMIRPRLISTDRTKGSSSHCLNRLRGAAGCQEASPSRRWLGVAPSRIGCASRASRELTAVISRTMPPLLPA